MGAFWSARSWLPSEVIGPPEWGGHRWGSGPYRQGRLRRLRRVRGRRERLPGAHVARGPRRPRGGVDGGDRHAPDVGRRPVAAGGRGRPPERRRDRDRERPPVLTVVT